MTRLASAALLVAGLAGCASPPQQHGNFIRNAPVTYEQDMASDAVKQLVAVYPPARTRFELLHAAPDAFGTSLVASLRGRGYALLEHERTPAAQGKAAVPEAAVAAAAAEASGLPLRYVLDQAGPDLYRLTLEVGNQSLSRAYLAQNGSIYPAGAWARKE